MPYFIGVTPLVLGEPISMSWKWIDGTNRGTRFNIIDGAAPSAAQVNTFAQAKAALSNAGLFKWKGAGQTQEIPQIESLVYDELYSIKSTMLVVLQSGSDPNLVAYDRIPAPNAAYMDGYQLDGTQAEVIAYLAAVNVVLNTGVAGDFAWASSILEGVDADIRILPNNVTDPGGTASPPAP